jgi:hypothetical protein
MAKVNPHSITNAINVTNVPQFKINLDLSIVERYAELTAFFKKDITEISQLCDNLYYSVVGSVGDFSIKTLLSCYRNQIMYYDEICYFTKIFNMPFHRILLLQLFYEVNAACTSISIKINNNNVLFRTMDWPMEFLKKITYQAEYYKNGIKLYTGVNWYGCVGLFTASNQKYAVSINFRREDTNNILQNIYRCISLHMPISYAIRYIFDNDCSYDDMLNCLKTIKLIAPTYITIVSNDYTSLVITRSPQDYTIEENDNYIIQTNIDDINNHKELNIMYSRERHKICENAIRINGYNFKSVDDVIKTFLIKPILNDDTIYVSVIDPKNFFITSLC